MHSQATGVSQPPSIVLGAEEPTPARRGAGRGLATPRVGGSFRRHHAGCGSLYISLLLQPSNRVTCLPVPEKSHPQPSCFKKDNPTCSLCLYFGDAGANLTGRPLSGPWTLIPGLCLVSLTSKDTFLAEFLVCHLNICLLSSFLSILSAVSGGL